VLGVCAPVHKSFEAELAREFGLTPVGDEMPVQILLGGAPLRAVHAGVLADRVMAGLVVFKMRWFEKSFITYIADVGEYTLQVVVYNP